MAGVEFSMRPGWQQELTTAILPKFRELGARMADGARADCPVDPDHKGPEPHLVNTIYHTVKNDGTIIIGASASYAIDVEMGHYIQAGKTPRKTAPSGFVPPQPFLRPQLFRRWNMS